MIQLVRFTLVLAEAMVLHYAVPAHDWANVACACVIIAMTVFAGVVSWAARL